MEKTDKKTTSFNIDELVNKGMDLLYRNKEKDESTREVLKRFYTYLLSDNSAGQTNSMLSKIAQQKEGLVKILSNGEIVQNKDGSNSGYLVFDSTSSDIELNSNIFGTFLIDLTESAIRELNESGEKITRETLSNYLTSSLGLFISKGKEGDEIKSNLIELQLAKNAYNNVLSNNTISLSDEDAQKAKTQYDSAVRKIVDISSRNTEIQGKLRNLRKQLVEYLSLERDTLPTELAYQANILLLFVDKNRRLMSFQQYDNGIKEKEIEKSRQERGKFSITPSPDIPAETAEREIDQSSEAREESDQIDQSSEGIEKSGQKEQERIVSELVSRVIGKSVNTAEEDQSAEIIEGEGTKQAKKDEVDQSSEAREESGKKNREKIVMDNMIEEMFKEVLQNKETQTERIETHKETTQTGEKNKMQSASKGTDESAEATTERGTEEQNREREKLDLSRLGKNFDKDSSRLNGQKNWEEENRKFEDKEGKVWWGLPVLSVITSAPPAAILLPPMALAVLILWTYKSKVTIPADWQETIYKNKQAKIKDEKELKEKLTAYLKENNVPESKNALVAAETFYNAKTIEEAEKIASKLEKKNPELSTMLSGIVKEAKKIAKEHGGEKDKKVKEEALKVAKTIHFGGETEKDTLAELKLNKRNRGGNGMGAAS